MISAYCIVNEIVIEASKNFKSSKKFTFFKSALALSSNISLFYLFIVLQLGVD